MGKSKKGGTKRKNEKIDLSSERKVEGSEDK
jgi:hypothetical protein